METRNFYRGQVYYVDLGAKVGTVHSKSRPVVVVSNNVGNANSPILTVIPLTSKPKKQLPTHCEIFLRNVYGTALAEQITTIPKDAVGDYAGCLSPHYLRNLNRAIVNALDLEGKYSNNAPEVHTKEIEEQKKRIEESLATYKEEKELYERMVGGTPKTITKVFKRRRSEEEIKSFIEAWGRATSIEELDSIAKNFGFSSRQTARTFYTRHIGD